MTREIGVNNRIKEILEEKGIRQKDLCEKTDISKQAMSNIVNHKCAAGLVLGIKIAKALNEPVEKVFELVEE